MEASQPRPKVLVVDDDGALRMMMRVNLELGGLDVVEAGTLDDAEAAVDAGGFAVVLLDVHVGWETNTDELLDRLRAEGTPVALVTGSVDVEPYRSRADAVLTKPFDPSALIALARRLARVEE
jgi:DNA-binding response OmpR family regulator